MGYVLDTIVRQIVVQGPETINSDYNSPFFDISKTEDSFSVVFKYDNGVSVDMNLYLQVSNDGTNFVDVDNSGANITDSDGLHMFDVGGSGAVFARVRVEVIGGSIDILSISFDGKRRH